MKKILAYFMSLVLVAGSVYASDISVEPLLNRCLASSGTALKVSITGNMPSVGAITADTVSAHSILSADSAIYWTGGRTTYVPLTGDISTYITNATAGDTIVLGAGTYTLTSAPITMSKKVHLKGMGRDITTLTSAQLTAGSTITNTADGGMISNMTISQSGAITGGRLMVECQANTVINNVYFTDTATTGAGSPAISAIKTTTAAKITDVFNCRYEASSAFRYRAFGNVGFTGSTLNFTNCSAGIGSCTLANYAADVFYATLGSINIYGGNFVNSSNSLGGGIVHTEGGTIFASNCRLNASAGAGNYDALNTSGSLTLSSCTLVNNTTSGTITYGGTVVSKNLSGDTVKIGTAVLTGDSTAPAGVVGRVRIITRDGASPCYIQLFAN